ncbi:MAG: glycine--tRNA ligase [Candidatus Nanoarchaeia archaeon]|nr:glycine--tRNA ligase [Candidatus Haiyanarchaeum thermophilum]MCW1302978.1 glycine--tRNA ligase [Candidatus Haiyanarchaeum thermophilum]MCW1303655.1 glycine--tRNA ligase [Candidatus Haiyanarchaeum thermophilum]MCW1306336.1 glycine--tRNA ligase [Candidatus Haiyanarchaeum thermophilum]MCW1307154.1 glycine--tRNA ligase [Candidatus Haiyanarchaeum thermophilum]
MSYDDVLKVALRRGIFFKTSEIYPNSPAGFWEYGPYGHTIKQKFIEALRKKLKLLNCVEIDGSIILPREVFEASSHLKSFVDPVVECTQCKQAVRANTIIEEKTGERIPEKDVDKINVLLEKLKLRCPRCGGKLSKAFLFNLMLKVDVGMKEHECYLRPETCQAIFLDFKRVFKAMRGKLPFAIFQVGKSFRNEISPRQSLVRMREFTQAEIEVFFNPKKEDELEFDWLKSFRLNLYVNGRSIETTPEMAVENGIISSKLVAFHLAFIHEFYESIGVPHENLRIRKLSEDEKAFYAKEAWDLEVLTSLGYLELVACNHRGDYDLGAHSKHSGIDLKVLDGGERVLPNVFELSIGVDRSILAILDLTYRKTKDRIFFSLSPKLAPIQVCVFPLVAKDGLPEKAQEVCKLLSDFEYVYEEKGSIGKRYYRYDEIGVPFAITIDYRSIKDDTITIRDRDTSQQVRINLNELREVLEKLLRGELKFEDVKGERVS